uniref:Ig-like domain-containing protein n=1 Tax=Poecilia formosa TaxID=48698 RepID=A0A087YH36_POEFO
MNPGASVTLSCEVEYGSTGWRFYWYKVVPDLSQNDYNINGTGENSFIIHGQKQTAGFACRAGRGNPEYLTDYSEPKFIWSADPHPAASLSVSPDREQHFTSESVTLNCGGNSTEWRVKEYGENYDGLLSDCSNSWEMTGSSCTIKSPWDHEAVFWCESGSGEFSNAVNISIIDAPESILTVSPSWLNPGASVTLRCEVEPSSTGWRFYWYKAVPDLSQNDYRYIINGTVQNSHIIHGQKHTAGFACRAGIGNPEYLTDYSEPTFVWTSDPHPAASLSVSPDREQHFTSESVTLNCGGNSAEWRVKRFRENYDEWRLKKYRQNSRHHHIPRWIYRKIMSDFHISDCSSWGLIETPLPTDESESILTVSPSWLNPGASVTLSCEVKPSSTGWRFYWYKAVPDLSKNNYRYELLPESINGTVGFACRAKGGNPEDFTDYSEPKFIWSKDPHPAASLSVSPDREQHFTSESVTLNCGGNSTEWRVRRFREEMTGSSCTITSRWDHKAVYWCESGSGEFSNAVNIRIN